MHAVCLTSHVQAQDRLIDGDPFDEITLDESNGNAVLRTLPLDFKNRVVPQDPDPLSKLRLRLVDRPKRQYDCEWQYIVKVRLFEQMVLEEAERLTREGDFTSAFEFYDFMLANYPKWPGLQASIDTFLYKQALAEVKAEQYERALGLLAELASRNAARKNLDRAFDTVAARVVSDRVKQERYDAARGAISLTQNLFKTLPMPKVARLRDQMIAQATALRDTAKTELAAGQLRRAQLASHRALAVWPDVDGVRELAREIDQKYPVAVVGVLQGASAITGREIDNWPSRRVARLLVRQLVELTAFSSEGGNYQSPIGSLARDDSGSRWSIALRPGIVGDDGAPITGYEIARLLLAHDNSPSEGIFDPWRDTLRGVAVRQMYDVQIQLARSLVRPERLLESAAVVPVPWPGETGETSKPTLEFLRPFQLADVGDESRFYANRKYFDFNPTQPQELIEQKFADSDDALRALRRGEVDVLDRVCPWDVASLRNSELIATDRYLLPTVHVLVANDKRPMGANRTLRRAVLYGLNRDVILSRVLLAGRPQDGSMVVSGPFVTSTSIEDPTGYGSDNTIKPVGYEPRLAMALIGVAQKELNPDAKPDSPVKKQDGPLIIAHAAEPVSRLACASMVEQLKRIGLEVELKEIDPGKSASGDDFDFLYAELAPWEPVVDARRLLGENGITGSCSAYMSLALAKLDRADTWKEVRRRLGEVHRIAADELAIIPLYQTTNFYAYRRGAVATGEDIVRLYEHVETWKQNEPVQVAR